MKLTMLLMMHVLMFSIDFSQGFNQNHFLLKYDLSLEECFIYKQFEKCFQRFQNASNLCQIPKKMHFVWLGVVQPQKQHQKNIISWIEKHPNWHVTLWTDHTINSFHPKLHIKRFKSSDCETLSETFLQTQNFSERANLVAYFLLYKYGGVYIDSDLECIQAIDALADRCDFFCPARYDENTVLSSGLFASKSIMGASTYHPVLSYVLQRIQAKWERYTQSFDNNDTESAKYLTEYRSVWPLTEAIIENSTPHTIVFPPIFFSTLSGKSTGIYAHKHDLPLRKIDVLTLAESIIKKSKNITKKHLKFQFSLITSLSILALFQILVVLSLFRKRFKT